MDEEEIRVRPQDSLVGNLLTMFSEGSPLELSFHDFHGLAGLIPEFRIPARRLQHNCAFCRHAKSVVETQADCVLNKLTVNRLILRRKQGLSGMCHFGLTDLVEPVAVDGQILGVLYYGSVVVKQSEEQAMSRAGRYCRRAGVNPRPFLRILAGVPRVTRSELQHHRERLRSLADTLARILVLCGTQTKQFKPLRPVGRMLGVAGYTFVVQKAVHYIDTHYNGLVDRESVASAIPCHPNHLSREFNRQMGFSLSEYLRRTRIAHARLLLSTQRLTAVEVAYEVGFSDQSHFSRTFKRVVGMTPKEFTRQSVART